jgi:MFS family permease
VTRALQGIGPAFLLPNGVALLGRAYPSGRRKDIAFSFFGLTAPLGFVMGATFSSLIGELAWWPWIYWIHAIVCFMAAALSFAVIPCSIDEYNPLRGTRGSLDVSGGVTGIFGLVLINFAWNQGPVVGWNTVYVYVTPLVGILAMGGFCESIYCEETE